MQKIPAEEFSSAVFEEFKIFLNFIEDAFTSDGVVLIFHTVEGDEDMLKTLIYGIGVVFEFGSVGHYV